MSSFEPAPFELGAERAVAEGCGWKRQEERRQFKLRPELQILGLHLRAKTQIFWSYKKS